MTSNSSKFFRKILKNSFLVTASGAAIMLSSSGALGAGARTVIEDAVFSTGAGLDGGGVVPFATNSTLQFTTDNQDSVDADLAVNIKAIDVNSKDIGPLTVNDDISLGSVSSTAPAVQNPSLLNIAIADTFTLTLTGTDGAGIAANTYDYLGIIDFPAPGGAGTLTVNSGAAITLSGLIADGARGTLNAETAVRFNDPSAASINTINIKGAANNYVELNADAGGLTILPTATSNINFNDVASVLSLTQYKNDNKTITFNNSLNGKVGNGGVVQVTGPTYDPNEPNYALTLQSVDGTKTVGGANKLNLLGVTGKVTVIGTAANKLDVSNALALDVYSDALFTDQSATSAAIKKINIGAAAPGGGVVGKAIYIVDVSTAVVNVNFLAVGGGNTLSFLSADSILTVQNTAGANKTIVFNNDVVGFGGGGGIVNLTSTNAANSLIVSGTGAQQLGATDNLAQLNITGKVTITGVVGDKLDVSRSNLLNVYNGALFTDQSATSAAIKKINIGAAAPGGGVVGKATYIVDVSTAIANVDFLAAGGGNTLSFLSADSILTVQNTAGANKTIVFNNDVVGFGGGGGIVNLTSTNAANSLIVSGTGAQQLGATDNLAQLNITGKVTITGAVGDKLDVSRSNLLNVYNGALFTDQSATSAAIKKINIGAAAPGGGVVGKATYIVDVSTAIANVNFLAVGGGNTLSFLSADSILTVQNTAGANKTIVFNNDVVGFGGGGGIVNLTSTNAANSLIVSGTGAQQLGATDNLAQLNITGKVTITGAVGDKLDVSRSNLLNVYSGATFTDQSATSGQIAKINVGEDPVGGVNFGKAEYTLDVSTAAAAAAGAPVAINLLSNADDANVLSLLDADSEFTIQNTAVAGQTVIFQNHVVGAAAGGGIVNLTSNGGNTLTVSGADAKKAQLGNTNNLTELNITGKVTVTGNATAGVNYNALDVSRSDLLNVYNGALFTDQSATSDLIAKINVGANPGGVGGATGSATHAIDVSYAAGNAIDLLTVADQIIFRDINSVYEIQNLANAQDTTVTLQNAFKGGYNAGVAPVANGGIIKLTSTNLNTLTVQSETGAQTLGAAGNALSKLGITGKVTIVGAAGKVVNISNTPILDVYNGATFTDASATSASITTINIGADPAGGAGTGPATHTIDVSTAAAVNLQGDNVIFKDAGSILKIQNTVGVNKTVTLANNIVGGVGGAGNGGIVELNADFAGGGSILTIDGGGGAGKSLGTAANKLQTLIFSGSGEIKLINKATFNAINLNLGVTAIELGDIVQHLEFSGDTTLTETGDIASVDFKGFNATINMANGQNITGTVTNTGVATNNGTIEFKGTGQIGGNISGLAMLKAGAGAVTLSAGGATKITEIQGTGTDTLTLGPDFKLTGAINSTGGTAVKLNFTNGGSVSGVVGTAANSVGGITTAGTTTFTSAVNSKGPIATAGNTTFSNSLNNIGDVTTSGTTIFTGAYTNAGNATFGGATSFANTFNNIGAVTTSGTTIFTGAYTNAGTATFGGTTNFASTFNNTGVVTTSGTTTYTGAYINKGTATFGGTTSFADTFNNTGAVTLAPGSINNFAKNVTATSFVASNATMNFSNSLAFNSSLAGSGTTINLGSGQLAYTAQGSFTDTLTLNSKFDGATNTGGNILITGANSKMDLSGVTKLKLVISTTNFDVNNVNPNTKYTLILAQDGGSLTELSSADIIETEIGGQENRFLKWTLNPSSLVLTASNISPEVIANATKDAPAYVKESLEILARAPADSEAGQFEDKLGLIIDNKTLVIEVIDSLQPDTVRTGDAVAAINTQATSGAITSAITSLNSRMSNLQVANNQNAAVSAGEEDEAKFGIWATPFVGNSTQKMRNNVNGNKSNFNGATVGFDGMLNDNLVLGVAYTRADSKIKQKNDKIGDSSKVNSNIYSIYGLYNLPTNNLFFEAVGSYGDSRVKNRTQHLLPTARNTITSQIAHGKYKSRSYTGQVMVGYDYVTAQANLTPMAGIRYSNIKDSGYTETGTTLQNLIVKGKKYNIVEGLAGAKVSTNVNVDQVILTPELYGLINYGFKNKAPAIDARLQGMDAPFPTSSFKSPKVSYNLGTGVTAKYQMMEYGVNYDVNIASKYFAQQGSLKVRVNF